MVGAAGPIASASSARQPVGTAVPARPLDAKLLHAMGEAILPSALGSEGIRRVVAEFQHWLREYSPGAELLHPYGSGEIRYAGPNPEGRWNEQLAALDTSARERFAESFAALDIESRRSIVLAVLERIDVSRLSAASDAEHVGVALLAFFYATSEAANLCYGAAINRYACRPLADSPAVPRHTQSGSGNGP